MNTKKLLLLAFWIGGCSIQGQNLKWVQCLQGSGSSKGHSLVVDGEGNIYTIGNFWGEVDFDPYEGEVKESAENGGYFIQKLGPSGNVKWVKTFQGNQRGGAAPVSISSDSSGNLILIGSFEETVDFGDSSKSFNLTSAGSSDIFIQKLDALGNVLWAKRIGGIGSDEGRDVAVDSGGNIYGTGSFAQKVDFDPNEGDFPIVAVGQTSIFVLKLDSEGNLLWVKGMGGDRQDGGHAIAVDEDANVYVTGYFSMTVDFDPNEGIKELTVKGGTEAFIQMLDAEGNLRWVRNFGGPSFDKGNDIQLDNLGNVYVTGSFAGSVDFDPGPGTRILTSKMHDIFVLKLQAGGFLDWAKGFGGDLHEMGNAIAVDHVGNVYTTGYFYNSSDFDPNGGEKMINSAGQQDAFVQKLDAEGKFKWVLRIGGPGEDQGCALATNKSGELYMLGNVKGEASLSKGKSLLKPSGGTGMFVQQVRFDK